MPGQGHYGPFLVWANFEAWEVLLKPKNDLHLLFWYSAIQRHKNSTLWTLVLTILAPKYSGKKWKISSENKSIFEKFTYTRVIYLIIKLRMCIIQIPKEKVLFFCEKKRFFWYPQFFPKKKDFSFTKNFKNKFQKWVF